MIQPRTATFGLLGCYGKHSLGFASYSGPELAPAFLFVTFGGTLGMLVSSWLSERFRLFGGKVVKSLDS